MEVHAHQRAASAHRVLLEQHAFQVYNCTRKIVSSTHTNDNFMVPRFMLSCVHIWTLHSTYTWWKWCLYVWSWIHWRDVQWKYDSDLVGKQVSLLVLFAIQVTLQLSVILVCPHAHIDSFDCRYYIADHEIVKEQVFGENITSVMLCSKYRLMHSLV